MTEPTPTLAPVPPPVPASTGVKRLSPAAWWARLAAAHVVGAVLCAAAVFFVAWFVHTNPELPRILLERGADGQWRLLGRLRGGWAIAGGSMEWHALAWALGATAVMLVIGRFYLEGHELYLPRGAAWALAYLFGLGWTGVVLEWLAIPKWLSRPTITGALLGLLAVLAARAGLRLRRPPESGLGGEAGAAEDLLRRRLAERSRRQSIEHPHGLGARAFAAACLALIAGITFFVFWHALLYPEVYWDSLILYLGYARMTFFEQGFPVKVVGQVGIGLGANYPHLYPVLGAGVATAMGAWSELPQRLWAPLAGVATTLLVYHTALDLTRRVNAALAWTLLYRSIPLGIAYDQYASDYALAMLFGAGFLYLALGYLRTGLWGYASAATMLIALAMHLNYLMGILWAPWAVMIVAAHTGRIRVMAPDPSDPAPWTALAHREPLGHFLRSSRFWGLMLIAAAVGSTWYVRNWIVTGNPVYAFFPQLFDGRNLNPDVMRAAAEEWLANGAGIGRFGATPLERLRRAWEFFVVWPQAYRTQPMLMGFALGGLLVWLARCAATPLLRRAPDPALRFGVVAAVLAVALLAFHVVLAPYYLYQIIKLLPCSAALAALAWPFWRPAPWRWALGALALTTGLVPGLTMSMMGFKIVNVFQPTDGGRPESQTTLYVLRHPLPTPQRFYRWRYGDDARMWDYLNDPDHLLLNRAILTHENRHLVLDPSIRLVHLDDWEMQTLWAVEDPAERVRRLVQDHGIYYYLRVPNEDRCATNRRMGTAEWPELGLAELVFEAGENKLYRLRWPPATQDRGTTTSAAR